MGNKKGLIWYLTLFDSEEKNNSVMNIPCQTIKEMGYYLDMSPQVISNYYHKQIRPRGVLKYCNISQNLNI